MKFIKFLVTRLITYVLVIFIGMSVVFFVTRLSPSDPVQTQLASMLGGGARVEPEAYEAMRQTLIELYGLEGSIGEQYVNYMRRVFINHDFGPSIMMYPIPVMNIISTALPWTIGLMGVSMIISWIIGNSIGLLVGVKKNKAYSKVLEAIAICIYPVPYYIFALLLIIFFAYVIPIFPISSNFNVSGFSLANLKTIVKNSFLPALSLVLTGTGWWVISMSTLSRNTIEEDYVSFAKMKGLSEGKVVRSYILPNTILPQVTMLALQVGSLFNGALITEILFTYPGIGSIIYKAILHSDYNFIMGSITISIIAVATATLIIDLIYPFLDPRIRYN